MINFSVFFLFLKPVLVSKSLCSSLRRRLYYSQGKISLGVSVAVGDLDIQDKHNHCYQNYCYYFRILTF